MARRRYRLLLFVAAVVVFLFYRTANNSAWDGVDTGRGSGLGERPVVKEGGGTYGPPAKEGTGYPSDQRPAAPPSPPEHGAEHGHGVHEAERPAHAGQDVDEPLEPPVVLPPVVNEPQDDAPAADAATTPAPVHDLDTAASDLPSTPTSSQVHWSKFPENFPVPDESLIRLPTGAPSPMPKIQHDFPPEAPAARTLREGRLAEIKAEMSRAWEGYRAFAWMHDELSPVSRAYRDPFCGWAATLVDSLDTLWIMGLKEEFDEAAEAVRTIDFTYSPTRNDIPVFETTIRYLGGLLAAYDVSGGAEGGYGMLLDKAEELAEILMGAFDTPNRMPVLYYHWRPEYVSQPRRASVVNVAELGSLLMEFTRLSQITGKDKYYDAVARITNGFAELQERGTTLGGLFPESLDVSGCNRTATNLERQRAFEEGGEGAKRPVEMRDRDGSGLVEVAASFAGPSYPKDKDNEAADAPEEAGEDEAAAGQLKKRGFREQNSETNYMPPNPWSLASAIDLDCVKQPDIVPHGRGYESYSVGGSQDSTYEYFPKEHLLLGGLEPKYRTLYEKTVASVKNWLLYRPMTPDNADILFAAKLTTRGDPATDASVQYEVPHLTCFLGGMFALGAKVFGLEGDIGIAARLTDGCVWAYGATPSGIMPEGSVVMPCEEGWEGECAWNETRWWQELDPRWVYREEQLAEYLEKKTEMEGGTQVVEVEVEVEVDSTLDEAEAEGEARLGADTPRIAKRQLDPDESDPDRIGAERAGVVQGAPDTSEDESADKIAADRAGVSQDVDAREDDSPDRIAAERAGVAQGTPVGNGVAGNIEPGEIPLEDPNRPLSHEEYVRARIEREKLPEGFVRIPSKRYILRPEAIESVWYMYRITGDPIWQEKGWKMWTSVISAVRTEVGASAILNVLEEEPRHADEMESFWLAETLKYFYLLFAEPGVVSLDEWVFNTEAHPFRRPDFEGRGV